MSAALILTGAPGSGKSSVLDALSTLLEIDETAFGALESEELARGWPVAVNRGHTLAARRRHRLAA